LAGLPACGKNRKADPAARRAIQSKLYIESQPTELQTVQRPTAAGFYTSTIPNFWHLMENHARSPNSTFTMALHGPGNFSGHAGGAGRGAEIYPAGNVCFFRRPVWRKTQTFWQRWKNHWAHFLLARIDPFVALRQFRTMEK
jgi:hypothetical protein